MHNIKSVSIADFSSALFWDVDKTTLSFEKHRRFIVERTLTHGTLSDWFLIKKIFGKAVIKSEITKVRYLDKLTLHFCSAYFKLPIQNFRCFTLQQLNLTHWDY